MALEKRVRIGSVTVQEDGQMSVRTDTVILDDGVEISRQFHRMVLDPATHEANNLSDGLAKEIAEAVWTQERVDARKLIKQRTDAAIANTQIDRAPSPLPATPLK